MRTKRTCAAKNATKIVNVSNVTEGIGRELYPIDKRSTTIVINSDFALHYSMDRCSGDELHTSLQSKKYPKLVVSNF